MMTSVVDVGWEIDGRSGLGLILLTLCFFFFTNFVCSLLPLPSVVAQKSMNDPFRIFRWRNLVISWIHASITGIWTVSCLIGYRKAMWEDMLTFKNWPCFGVCCFSTGYFIYDTLDIVVARRMREKWEILVHHTAIVVIAIYAVSTVTGMGYHVLSMSIEFNTTFLHLRKLLQLAAVPRTNRFLQLNRYLNLVTFLIFRFGPLGLLFRAIYLDCWRVPMWFMVLFSVAMLVLTSVNLILFVRLVRADCKGWFVKDRPSKPFMTHRKIDSFAGVCGSMQVAEDCTGAVSRNPSQVFNLVNGNNNNNDVQFVQRRRVAPPNRT